MPLISFAFSEAVSYPARKGLSEQICQANSGIGLAISFAGLHMVKLQ